MMKLIIAVFFFAILTTVFARDRTSSHVDMLYTTNLNGALDDCGCGNETVGGLTRIITLVNNFRDSSNNVLLVDAGDFLSSYSSPGDNRTMLRLMALAEYDVVNLGDQEFVESPQFVFDVNRQFRLRLPLLFSNTRLLFSRKTEPLSYRLFHINDLSISVVALMDGNSFEFISPQQISVAAPEAILQQLEPRLLENSQLQIVLFHGTWQKARALTEKFSWIDVMVLAHNQRREFLVINRTAFVESGVEGEYLGHLRIEPRGKQWRFRNEFLPVLQAIPESPSARQLMENVDSER